MLAAGELPEIERHVVARGGLPPSDQHVHQHDDPRPSAVSDRSLCRQRERSGLPLVRPHRMEARTCRSAPGASAVTTVLKRGTWTPTSRPTRRRSSNSPTMRRTSSARSRGDRQGQQPRRRAQEPPLAQRTLSSGLRDGRRSRAQVLARNPWTRRARAFRVIPGIDWNSHYDDPFGEGAYEAYRRVGSHGR